MRSDQVRPARREDSKNSPRVATKLISSNHATYKELSSCESDSRGISGKVIQPQLAFRLYVGTKGCRVLFVCRRLWRDSSIGSWGMSLVHAQAPR
eukprot:CAMPEP_0195570448 /NCGR_PEP_ID=MMETSP0814-20130614/3463_1 /TAXON_ID=97485 /ORGANISM="Prymnesium parvum, Strain Texoma1" /LENGTH=94 /DNA_ID=CAMNT_0040705947 /DNA_START=244 /DNA_END=525 /DNA_ORIENTATION=-